MKKKKESNFGLIVLVLILLGAVGYVYYYNNSNKSTPTTSNTTKKEEEPKVSEDVINELYNIIKSDYNSSNAYTKQDLTQMEQGLSYDKFSDELKIYYSIKNIPEENITKKNVKVNNQVNGYTFSGKVIDENIVANQIKLLNNDLTLNHKTLTLVDRMYLYDAKQKCYLIYEKKVKPTIVKVNYMESESTDNEVYIYVYSAYTRNNNTSFTRHNNLLPINITEKNIVENLDIIDKYKYTFKLDASVNKYYLTDIKYIKQDA